MSALPSQQAAAMDALRQAFMHHQDARTMRSLIELVDANDQFIATLQEEVNRMVCTAHTNNCHALNQISNAHPYTNY